MHVHFHGDAHTQPNLALRLMVAAALTLGFVIFEVAAGLSSNSLAVVSDAAQNFVDAMALVLVWWSQRLSSRPADRLRTFGYHRANIVVALLNSAFLGLVVVDIAYNAFIRFFNPQAVDGTILGAAGLLGLVVNLLVALLLRSNSNKLHVRGAYLHNLADALGCIFLLVSGVLIKYTGAAWIDLVLALGLCTAITCSMVPVARKAVHILLEGTPEGVDTDEIAQAIMALPNVVQVHDLHAWTHGDGMAAMTCHVCVNPGVPHEQDHLLTAGIRAMLSERFGLTHSTIQIEHASCEQTQKCVWRGTAEHAH